MTRPTLAAHAQEIALLKMAHSHSLEHDQEMLTAMKELRDEVRQLRTSLGEQVTDISERQSDVETKLKVVQGMARGVGIGFAAAFTMIGAAIGAGIDKIVGLFS